MSDVFQRNRKYAKPGPYETQLGPLENAFRQWVKDADIPFDPTQKNPDYDMRGFYRAMLSGQPEAMTAINPYDKQIHFPDTWKTPFHESFSNESMYALPSAPKWIADRLLVDPQNNQIIFRDDQ